MMTDWRPPHRALTSVVATFLIAQMAQAADPSAPNLLFNYTLRPTDAPLELDFGWKAATSDVGGPQQRTGSYATALVSYIGNGIAFLGKGGDGWSTTGSDGLPQRAGYVIQNNDPSFVPSTQDINAPSSDTALWQRQAPRFQKYETSIVAINGDWRLDTVTVMTGMQSPATSLSDVPTTVQNFIGDDGKLNPFYNLTGRWEVQAASNGLPQHAMCYDDAVVRISVPAGTAYMMVNGTRDVSSTNMYARVFTEDDSSGNTTVIKTAFTAPTESMFFMTPLDPKTQYLFTILCAFTPSVGQHGFTSMTFYQGSSDGSPNGSASGSSNGSNVSKSVGSSSRQTTGTARATGGADTNSNNGNSKSSSGISTGAIVGIVVGVVVLALAALLVWFCVRRRKNRVPPQPPHGGIAGYESGKIEGGEVDPNIYPTPYEYQPQVQPVSVPNYYSKPGGNPTNMAPPTYSQAGGPSGY